MPAATASATTITPAAIHQAVVLLTWGGWAGAGTGAGTGGSRTGACDSCGRSSDVGCVGTVAALMFFGGFAFSGVFRAGFVCSGGLWAGFVCSGVFRAGLGGFGGLRTGGGGGSASAGANVSSSVNPSSSTVAQGDGRTVQSDARA